MGLPYTVNQIIFAASNFLVFVVGDIFAAIFFADFKKLKNNFRDFSLLWPVDCFSRLACTVSLSLKLIC